ncbi:SpaA isopeptide-forming pilin-related protein [Limosilactobacillus mucosae]|uniref:SpaA isopeptide-forming pilin-related protein n=1 Tax=Limosilactobacillus mucosae TaxID=97478 RepID=UPI00399377F3
MIKRGALFCVSLAFSLMLLVSFAMTGSYVFASELSTTSSNSSQSIVNSTSVNNQSKQDQNSTTAEHTAVSAVSSNHQPQDVSDRITNLTVVERDSKKSQSIYNDGAYVTVSGTFSDARGKIRGGDTIHVNWPNSGQAYVNSYVGGKDLYVNGAMVGHYTVDQTGATLTFNDKINDLQNVSGNFSFDVEVRNTDEQNQTIQITAGSTAASIPVKGITKGSSEQPSGKGWRGDKVGMILNRGDHNALAWGIYLNSNAAALGSDIICSDTIQGGQQFDPDSAYNRITVNGQSLSFDQFKAAYPNSSIEINGKTLTFRFNKDEFSGKTILVGYGTKITDNDLAVFNNTANVSYQLREDSQPTTVEYSYSVKNVSFDANVTGTKPGEMKIINKYTDDEGKIKILPDATFEVIKPDSESMTYTTDENGVIDIKDLPAGKYTIKQITVPDWIDFSKAKDQTWTIEISDRENGTPLIVYNEVKKSIPWTPLTPAKEVKPWTPLTPAKEVKPWTPLTPAKEVKPWTPLTPAKEVKPWTPLTPAKDVKPWAPLTPAKDVKPWAPLTPAKDVKPWAPLTPAKDVKPWAPLTPAKDVKPWAPLTPAKDVKPWAPLTPAKDVKPWVPLTPAKDVKPWAPLTPAKDIKPWAPLTPAAIIKPADKHADSEATSTPSTSAVHINKSNAVAVNNCSSQPQPVANPAADNGVIAQAQKLLPKTGNHASNAICWLGVMLCVSAAGWVVVSKKKNN